MSSSDHTYGPTCDLTKAVAFSGIKPDDDTPPLRTQFFYTSPLPIDDPLTPIPTPSGDGSGAKHPPRPFSTFDNNALEEAWLGLGDTKAKRSHSKLSPSPIKARSREDEKKREILVKELAAKHVAKHDFEDETGGTKLSSQKDDNNHESKHDFEDETSGTKLSSQKDDNNHESQPGEERFLPAGDREPCCKELEKDIKWEQHHRLRGSKWKRDKKEYEVLLTDIIAEMQRQTGGRLPQMREDNEMKRSDSAKGRKDDIKRSESRSSKRQSLERSNSKSSRRSFRLGKGSRHGRYSSRNGEPTNHDGPQDGSEDGGHGSDCSGSSGSSSSSSSSDHDDRPKKPSLNHGSSSEEKRGSTPKNSETGTTGSSSMRSPARTGSPARPAPDSVSDGSDSSRDDDHTPKRPASNHDSVSEEKIGSIPKDPEAGATESPPRSSGGPVQDKEPANKPSSPLAKPQSKPKNVADSRTTGSPVIRPAKRSDSPVEQKEPDNQPSSPLATPQPNPRDSFDRSDDQPHKDGQKSHVKNHKAKNHPKENVVPKHVADSGTTGSPFIRPPSRSDSPVEQKEPADEPSSPLATMQPMPDDAFVGSDDEAHENDETVHVERCKAKKHTKANVDIPVGVSRLHLVQLPALQMKPIYWSPVHDIAAVIRGTWFYRDSMYPVESAVANQLELGYRELRPWSQTWNDEISSALQIGADGEEKIAHRLWPREGEETRGRSMSGMPNAPPSDPYCAARCFNGEMAAEGTIEVSKSDEKKQATATLVRRYPNAQVVYRDSHNAYILKPTLQPSAYYGRRPLAKISKGVTIGIHVVRGFDWKLWSKVHPEHKSAAAAKAEDTAPVSETAATGKKAAVCRACKAHYETPKVTDLVLVIHGIGQKLSERVESFHFTHAINSFRRAVNVELADEKVQSVLRRDLGGVMVLPVNWRAKLSFEDGGPRKGGDKDQPSDFSLKDITPETMPSVRNVISDVMLDIPFYMSNHKPKMIEALIYEANRVYNLWCQNNPDFHKEGRVHIIAHSLGSAMALDVLSKQPTIPPQMSSPGKKIHTKHFDFDTKSLFFVGSPAGFFLLLEKGKLLPRRGRKKIGAEKRYDEDENITGEAGTFGCLAVDNLYNIMHYNDPITYRLNATVDAAYASSLKNAQVPSASAGFASSLRSSISGIIPGMSHSAPPKVGELGHQPPPSMNRLPSQLEMEVHDFSREELAENKFLLLNDNGQIDWFLSSGGGPLEIQYLNMLSAHSSYWTSPDFVRLLVTEVGRRAGKGNSLPNMRPVKKTVKEKEKAKGKDLCNK